MKQVLVFTIFLYLFSTTLLNAQQDDFLDDLLGEQINYATATFKSTRIMNGHSIEQTHQGELSFRISHRFGPVNRGIYELYGIDQAVIHFSFEYGITPWLMAGIGRSNLNKTYDGFIKARILQQSSGKRMVPIHLSYFSSFELNTLRNAQVDYEWPHRLSYAHQILLARKFNKTFSFQLTPTLIHQNLVESRLDNNDILALGIGGRAKLSNRISINSEIFLHNLDSPDRYFPFALGVDLETGGHVFQLILTNAQAMREVGFITQTNGNWFEGDIHFGFNISRVFNIVNYE